MKDALHMGGSADLNIYTAKLNNTQTLLGWATFPDWLDPDNMYYSPKMDGVVLNYMTLPGGDLQPWRHCYT